MERTIGQRFKCLIDRFSMEDCTENLEEEYSSFMDEMRTAYAEYCKRISTPISLNDYVVGTERFGSEVRRVFGFVQELRADGSALIVCNDNYQGFRANEVTGVELLAKNDIPVSQLKFCFEKLSSDESKALTQIASNDFLKEEIRRTHTVSGEVLFITLWACGDENYLLWNERRSS